MVKEMNKKELVKSFSKAVEEMKKNHDWMTYFWYLDTDNNNNNWAIVLGRQDGFEEAEDINDKCAIGTCRLCAKLAYQTSNSIMQEYEIDWLMPYNEETMEVEDNEISIYQDSDLEEIIDWLLKCFDSYEYLFK